MQLHLTFRLRILLSPHFPRVCVMCDGTPRGENLSEQSSLPSSVMLCRQQKLANAQFAAALIPEGPRSDSALVEREATYFTLYNAERMFRRHTLTCRLWKRCHPTPPIHPPCSPSSLPCSSWEACPHRQDFGIPEGWGVWTYIKVTLVHIRTPSTLGIADENVRDGGSLNSRIFVSSSRFGEKQGCA